MPRCSRRSYQQHRGVRKYSLQEEPQWKREGRRVSVQPEDEALNEADLEELDSHRSDDPRGLRRPKIHRVITITIHHFVKIHNFYLWTMNTWSKWMNIRIWEVCVLEMQMQILKEN